MNNTDNLMGALRRVLATTLAIGQSRLELAGIEAAEAGERMVIALLVGVIGILLVFAALLGLSAWGVLVLWDSFGPALLLGLTLVYLVAGLSLLARARRKLRSGQAVFEATGAELRRDMALLRGETDPAAPR